jgi:hypothetical protein
MLATLFFSFPLAGLVCLKRPNARGGAHRSGLTICCLVLILALLSCGGGLKGNGGGSGNPGTPAGTYSVTVTATCGAVAGTAQVSLTVTP